MIDNFMQKERLRFFPYSLFFGGVISFLIGLRSWRYRLPRWIIPLGVYCKYIISFFRRIVNDIPNKPSPDISAFFRFSLRHTKSAPHRARSINNHSPIIVAVHKQIHAVFLPPQFNFLLAKNFVLFRYK